MACNRKPGQPLPCQQLAQAQQQLNLLLSGQAVAAIETPQLGRVEYTKTDAGQLQQLIDSLAQQCLAAGGDPSLITGYSARRGRRPISVEAWP